MSAGCQRLILALEPMRKGTFRVNYRSQMWMFGQKRHRNARVGGKSLDGSRYHL